MDEHFRRSWRCVIAALLTACLQPAAAQDDRLAAGRQAFAVGDYAAAADAFEHTLRSTGSSAALQFNLGASYYRLGRYAQAARAFEEAAAGEAFTALAHYNLGLVALARGERAAALDWFARTRQESTDDRLSALARRAQLQARRMPDTTAAPPLAFDGTLRVGLGHDDNIYLSPADPYVDLARNARPLVTPVLQSGFYVPVRALGRFSYRASNRSLFDAQYLFFGDLYLEGATDNADRTAHSLQLGQSFRLGTQRRERFRIAVAASRLERSNFDRDTGIDRDIAGLSIRDRFNFTDLGGSAEYAHYGRNWRLTLGGQYADRNYDDEIVVSEFDHTLAELGAELRLLPRRGTRLSAAYQYSHADYAERTARDRTGALLPANDLLEYDYHLVTLELRQRLAHDWRAWLSYTFEARNDAFAGYHDYTLHELRARLHYGGNGRWSASGELGYWDRNYPNAFAFNTPLGGRRQDDGYDAMATVEWRLNDQLALRGELHHWRENSNDARIDYRRTQGLIGLEWNF